MSCPVLLAPMFHAHHITDTQTPLPWPHMLIHTTSTTYITDPRTALHNPPFLILCIEQAMGDNARAVEGYRTCLALDEEGIPDAHFNLGVALQETGG